MSNFNDFSPLKQLPILEVARRLGIDVRHKQAMCFTGHDSATRSLTFWPEKNIWKCFGACGKRGTTIDLVMEKEEIDFVAALKWFACNFGVDVTNSSHRGYRRRETRSSIKRLIVPPAATRKHEEFSADPEVYEWFLSKCAPVSSDFGLQYLATHGITVETAAQFNVRELRDPSYAVKKLIAAWGKERLFQSGIISRRNGLPERLVWNSSCILFPFTNDGKTIYIQARMQNGDRKFLNLRGSAPIFNIDGLSSLSSGETVHICEGVPDALALHTHGLTAVGILGAHSFRAEWVDYFWRFKVVVLGDGDPAGKSFARKISTAFSARGKSVDCLALPIGKDVANVLTEGSFLK